MGIEKAGEKGLAEGMQIAGRSTRRVLARTEALVERVEEGLESRLKDVARVKVPRSRIPALLRPGADAVEILRALNAPIIAARPELAHLKFQRMATDPLSFLRGSNGLFGTDMVRQKQVPVRVLLQGDAHLLNLGTCKTPDDVVALYLNDFDEAVKGPFDWDLRRLAVSIRLAAKEAGLGTSEADRAVVEALRAYRKHLAGLSTKGPKTLEKLPEMQSRPARKLIEKAENRTREDLLEHWTVVHPGKGRLFKEIAGAIGPTTSAEKEAISKGVREYLKSVPPGLRRDAAFYQVKDVAVRLSGTGSLGNRNYYVLIEGKEPGPAGDFILQFKEEPGAAYAALLGILPAKHEGARVVKAQQILQPGADRYLGFATIDGVQYAVRQIQPTRVGIDLQDLANSKDLRDFAADAGTILAHAHARGGNAAAISQYLDGSGTGLSDEIAAFARQYAAQVAQDFRAFRSTLAKNPLLQP